VTTTIAAERDAYRESFARFAEATSGEPDWLRERRTSAFGRFVVEGLPTSRDEAWRHTPIGPITGTRWEPAPRGEAVSDEVREATPSLDGSRRAVLVDGYFRPELSTLDGGHGELEVHGLRALLDSRPERLQPLLGTVQNARGGAFADLNAAFASDGLVVFLPAGVVVEEPLHVAHVATGRGAGTVSYTRVLVVASRGAKARIVETFSGPGGSAYLTNAVTEVVVDDNSFVDHYTLQREGESGFHLSTLAARLGRDARFANHSFNLGAAISRNDIDVRFDGEGGECALNGLFMVDGTRLTDTHSRVDHARPHCSSRELYKGVLGDSSRGVFNGLIQVRPGAQKTDAEQMNRNLLLSKEALVHAVPQLEILADDVKCRHGSTTGQLDPAALFYLRSRGIGVEDARALLTWAFAGQLVHGLPLPSLREEVQKEVRTRLGSGVPVGEATA
jgi:Fe-S cluster assembly protein SufD